MIEQIFYTVDELDNLVDNEQVIVFDENGNVVAEGYFRNEGYVESNSSVVNIQSNWYVMKRTSYHTIITMRKG